MNKFKAQLQNLSRGNEENHYIPRS